MALFEIQTLLSVYENIKDSLRGRSENIIHGHKVINSAFIKTYDYLRNRNGQYLPNPELAELWNQASAEIMKVDRGLGDMLYYKSRFWLDPQLYINLNRESEIIELNQIVNEMEKLRMRL